MSLGRVAARGMCTLKNPTAPEKPLGFAYNNFFKHKELLPAASGYVHDLRVGRLKYAAFRYMFTGCMVAFFPFSIIYQKLMKK